MTAAARAAVLSADKVIVRTAHTRSYQSVVELGVAHVCLDDVYQNSRSFSTLNKNLAKQVKAQAVDGSSVVYLVDGAACEDNSVKALLKMRGVGKIKIENGVSKVSALLLKAGFESCSYTALSAYEGILYAHENGLSAPLIVYDLDDRALASDLKLVLADYFGEETTVKYIIGEKVKSIPLYELDRQKRYDYTSAVAVEGIPLLKKSRFKTQDLHTIIELLRRPNGCPWDRVQTPSSIKMNAVEEAYELVDAIDSGDTDKVLEETGDLLMQVVFHAVMMEEKGAFNLSDVASGVCEKLITRHTHVFGEDKAANADSALSVWDKNKMKEKNQDTYAKAVNDVPKCFPALMQAQKIAKRVEKGGWGYREIEDKSERYAAVKKDLLKELAELDSALQSGDAQSVKEEAGDLLMCAAWLAREAGVDAEEALLDNLRKVKNRYTAFENAVLSDGKDVLSLTDQEREYYYALSKKQAKDGAEK